MFTVNSGEEKMKKKKRIIKWIALGVVLTGIVALAVVAGMYTYHHAQTEYYECTSYLLHCYY